jgi:DNA polymerase-3 subunit epsilon
MRLIGFDIETTGLEPADHRIIEIYGALWSWTGSGEPKKIDDRLWRIQPGRNIPIESQRIHGISAADLEGCPLFASLAPGIHEFMSDCDLWVGHNAKSFDVPFLNHEFVRAGLTKLDRPLVDTMLEARWATPNGKVPNLGELCFACDVPYDTSRAHKADYDVDCTMQCLFAGLSWGRIALPSPAPVIS